MWPTLGKMLLITGIVLTAAGLLLIFGAKIPFLGRLPGDIHIRRPNFTFTLPLTTCLLLSAALTLILWLVSKLKG